MGLNPTKDCSIRIGNEGGRANTNDIVQFQNGDNGVVSWIDSNGIHQPLLALVPVVVTTTVTAAQLKHLVATPVIVAPAPGLGLYMSPQGVTLLYHYIGGAFTPGNGDNLYVSWGTNVTNNYFSTFNQTGVIDQTHDVYANSMPTTSGIDATIVENAAFYLGSAGTEITGSTTLSHVHITVTYTLLPL